MSGAEVGEVRGDLKTRGFRSFVFVNTFANDMCSFVFVCVRSPNFEVARCVRELALFANSSRTFVRENCEAPRTSPSAHMHDA